MVSSLSDTRSQPTHDPALNTVGWQNIQAVATAFDGFTVRSDFMDEIVEYLRRETIFWPMLKKRAAEADVVREMRETAFPDSGFVSKIDLNPVENSTSVPASRDLSDPGQEVKALGGIIEFGHYARSLYTQQGKPYGDIVAERTDKLLISTARQLEQALFIGNAAQNPLQFNGITLQMQEGHTFEADLRGSTPDSIVRKIRSIVRLATSDILIKRKISVVWTSGLGLERIEIEVGNSLTYHNLIEITPGLQVPAVITQSGRIPIIPSPYIIDTPGSPNGLEADNPDIIDFYLLDMDLIEWRGVLPEGGTNSFDPQIFDVSIYGSGAPYLVEKRMGLIYGTLYCHNRGEGIYRLRVKVPRNTVNSI